MHLLIREYSSGLHGEIEKAQTRFVTWMFDSPDGPGSKVLEFEPAGNSPNLVRASEILKWDVVNFNWALTYATKVGSSTDPRFCLLSSTEFFLTIGQIFSR